MARRCTRARRRGSLSVAAEPSPLREGIDGDGVRFLTKRGYVRSNATGNPGSSSRIRLRSLREDRRSRDETGHSHRGARDEMEPDPRPCRRPSSCMRTAGWTIPSVDPPTRRTIDEFRRDDIDTPSALLDAFFIAIDKDGPVTRRMNMFRSLDDPTFLWQGITSVRRDARARASAHGAQAEDRSLTPSITDRAHQTWTTSTTSRCSRSTRRWASRSSAAWISYEKTSSALTER